VRWLTLPEKVSQSILCGNPKCVTIRSSSKEHEIVTVREARLLRAVYDRCVAIVLLNTLFIKWSYAV